MSVFNNRFSVSEIRGIVSGSKTGGKQRSVVISKKEIKRLSLLEEIVDRKLASSMIEDNERRKLLKTEETQELSTFDTVTKTSASSTRRQSKKVTFKDPLRHEVKIESFKQFNKKEKFRRHDSESCKCLIF
jgi:hypothetical protein